MKAILVAIGLSKEWPTYTLEDVQLHNCEESMWIVAGTDIYDVTGFVYDHPGGSGAIIKRAGGARDCTQDLHFHSKQARTQWKLFKIGEVGKKTTGTILPPRRQGSVNPAAAAGAVSSSKYVGVSMGSEGSVENEKASASCSDSAKCCSTNILRNATPSTLVAPSTHCEHCCGELCPKQTRNRTNDRTPQADGD